MLLASLFSLLSPLQAKIVDNESLIAPKAAEKIEQITNELYQKTGVTVAISARNDLPEGVVSYGQKVGATLNKPYVVVVLSTTQQKIDITSSDDIKEQFDKNKVLDNYMIPIIVAPNRDDAGHKYEAAILNGVSEIAEEIAASRSSTLFNMVSWVVGTGQAKAWFPNDGIDLASALGNTTQNFINFLRILFYGMLILSVYAYIQSRRSRRDDDQKTDTE